MDKYREKFDHHLKDFFINHPKLDVYNEICLDGKRLRPILILGIATFLNPEWENTDLKDKIYKFALIVELIHNTSLIIDDLPSMDNDKYRRNNLTFHYKYGVKKAYLMIYNLLIIIKKMILELLELLDKFSNESLRLEELINLETGNLIQGQSWDLNETWKPLLGSRSLKIAEYKTTSLFRLSIVGVFFLINNASDALDKGLNKDLEDKDLEDKDLEDNLLKISENLGMAFQLSDDYLDVNIDKKYNNYALETSSENLKDKFNMHINDLENHLKKIELNEYFMNELIFLLKKRLDKH